MSFSLLWLVVSALPSVQAQLNIEITKGVEGALPIAVVPFANQAIVGADRDFARIIRADLRRSGRFDPLPEERMTMQPTAFAEVDTDAWRRQGADYVVVGQVRSVANGFEVRFQLADTLRRREPLSLAFTSPENELRQLAHHIADLVYQHITDERGAFATKIAYVTATGKGASASYALSIADADGYGPREVLRSRRPLMSPAWSPDGLRLAYVTFEQRKAQVVVQELYSGQRRVVSATPGINGAPAWSPDGRRLALTLSRDGNPEIYLLTLNGGALIRVTENSAIDTEPSWSPDGQFLVFTSDRSGSPQIYQKRINAQRARRVTFEGDYNARARYSPDGRSLVMVQRRGGRFSIVLMDLQSRRVQRLTDGALDESPSFAPNGRMIIYATSERGRGELAAVSADGRVAQRLSFSSGEVREPSWAPYTRSVQANQ